MNINLNTAINRLTQAIDDIPQSPKERLHDLQFAVDDYGNRRVQTDPAYRKYVEQEYQKQYPGTGEINPKVVKQDEWWK